MKSTIPYWQMVGFVFTSVAGTLLHFLFDWTGGNVIAAVFSAINESIWEHMKLLYYPILIFALIEYRAWGREVQSFWCVKLIGFLMGLMLIPALYYTYTGILGVSADWFNIAIFFIAAAAAFRLETTLFQDGRTCPVSPKTALGLMIIIACIFTVFTFAPPHIPFFRDPVTGTYGFSEML